MGIAATRTTPTGAMAGIRSPVYLVAILRLTRLGPRAPVAEPAMAALDTAAVEADTPGGSGGHTGGERHRGDGGHGGGGGHGH